MWRIQRLLLEIILVGAIIGSTSYDTCIERAPEILRSLSDPPRKRKYQLDQANMLVS